MCWYMAGQEGNVPRPLGRLPAVATQVSTLEVSVSKDRPTPSCHAAHLLHVFSYGCEVKSFSQKYCKCDVGFVCDKKLF